MDTVTLVTTGMRPRPSRQVQVRQTRSDSTTRTSDHVRSLRLYVSCLPVTRSAVLVFVTLVQVFADMISSCQRSYCIYTIYITQAGRTFKLTPHRDGGRPHPLKMTQDQRPPWHGLGASTWRRRPSPEVPVHTTWRPGPAPNVPPRPGHAATTVRTRIQGHSKST